MVLCQGQSLSSLLCNRAALHIFMHMAASMDGSRSLLAAAACDRLLLHASRQGQGPCTGAGPSALDRSRGRGP